MNKTEATEIISSLGFVIDEVYQLSDDDWNFIHPPGKSEAALFGLAIDRRVKSIVEASGAKIGDRFAEWDYNFKDVFVDIKSFSKSSISISERELGFGEKRLEDGKEFLYMIFEQLTDGTSFMFRGFISLSVLLAKNKIQESQYSGYYFTLNDSVVKRELFE